MKRPTLHKIIGNPHIFWLYEQNLLEGCLSCSFFLLPLTNGVKSLTILAAKGHYTTLTPELVSKTGAAVQWSSSENQSNFKDAQGMMDLSFVKREGT